MPQRIRDNTPNVPTISAMSAASAAGPGGVDLSSITQRLLSFADQVNTRARQDAQILAQARAADLQHASDDPVQINPTGVFGLQNPIVQAFNLRAREIYAKRELSDFTAQINELKLREDLRDQPEQFRKTALAALQPRLDAVRSYDPDGTLTEELVLRGNLTVEAAASEMYSQKLFRDENHLKTLEEQRIIRTFSMLNHELATGRATNPDLVRLQIADLTDAFESAHWMLDSEKQARIDDMHAGLAWSSALGRYNRVVSNVNQAAARGDVAAIVDEIKSAQSWLERLRRIDPTADEEFALRRGHPRDTHVADTLYHHFAVDRLMPDMGLGEHWTLEPLDDLIDTAVRSLDRPITSEQLEAFRIEVSRREAAALMTEDPAQRRDRLNDVGQRRRAIEELVRVSGALYSVSAFEADQMANAIEANPVEGDSARLEPDTANALAEQLKSYAIGLRKAVENGTVPEYLYDGSAAIRAILPTDMVAAVRAMHKNQLGQAEMRRAMRTFLRGRLLEFEGRVKRVAGAEYAPTAAHVVPPQWLRGALGQAVRMADAGDASGAAEQLNGIIDVLRMANLDANGNVNPAYLSNALDAAGDLAPILFVHAGLAGAFSLEHTANISNWRNLDTQVFNPRDPDVVRMVQAANTVTKYYLLGKRANTDEVLAQALQARGMSLADLRQQAFAASSAFTDLLRAMDPAAVVAGRLVTQPVLATLIDGIAAEALATGNDPGDAINSVFSQLEENLPPTYSPFPKTSPPMILVPQMFPDGDMTSSMGRAAVVEAMDVLSGSVFKQALHRGSGSILDDFWRNRFWKTTVQNGRPGLAVYVVGPTNAMSGMEPGTFISFEDFQDRVQQVLDKPTTRRARGF